MLIAWQDPRRLYSFYEVQTPGVKKIIELVTGIPQTGKVVVVPLLNTTLKMAVKNCLPQCCGRGIGIAGRSGWGKQGPPHKEKERNHGSHESTAS